MRARPVYLDYQATTPIDPKARAAMQPFLGDMFGNPHSGGHRFGWEAAQAIREARSGVASLINADDDEVVFTSGATESCNLALRGVANPEQDRGRDRIVTLATEHPAVLETVMDLERWGYRAVVVPVDGDGLVDLDVLRGVLDERTLVLSVMAANNEIGVLQPISDIAALCRRFGVLFHTDATQAVGRIPVDVEAWDVDLLSFSSHKAYGPKGVGALYVRSGVKLKPVITGGRQERGLRGGTLSPALIAGFGVACEIAAERREGDRAKLEALTRRLHRSLLDVHPGMRLFGHPLARLPGSLSVGFPGLSADEVIRSVSDEIAVSSGAACSSTALEPSRVLLALGLGPEAAASGVRISLGRFTTGAEVDRAITALASLASPAHCTEGVLA